MRGLMNVVEDRWDQMPIESCGLHGMIFGLMCLAKRIRPRKVGVIIGQEVSLPPMGPGRPFNMDATLSFSTQRLRHSGCAAPGLLWSSPR